PDRDRRGVLPRQSASRSGDHLLLLLTVRSAARHRGRRPRRGRRGCRPPAPARSSAVSHPDLAPNLLAVSIGEPDAIEDHGHGRARGGAGRNAAAISVRHRPPSWGTGVPLGHRRGPDSTAVRTVADPKPRWTLRSLHDLDGIGGVRYTRTGARGSPALSRQGG